MNIVKKYEKRAEKVKSLLCVGLDSDFEKLPEKFKTLENPQFEFNKWIIEETNEYVSAYKPNIAFYESQGEKGWHELKLTMEYLRENFPDIFTICDAKRGDISSTSEDYAKAIFDYFGFDAITLNPYMGKEALEPFLRRDEKASIILCRTSNPGAKEIQDLDVNGKPLWLIVAEKASREWNENENLMLVVGATYPSEMKQVREVAGEMTILAPGVGSQEGNLEEAIKNGLNSKRQGLIINSSRSIIFSENPKGAAEKLKEEINRFR